MANKRQGIDIDNLDISNIVEESTTFKAPTGPAPLVANKPTGVNAIFDKHKKMIFLFDVSGSMGDGMLPDEIDKLYIWTDDKEREFLAAMHNNARAELKRRLWVSEEDFDAKFAEMVKTQMVENMIMDLMFENEDENFDPNDIDEDAVKTIVEAKFNLMDDDEKADRLFYLAYGMSPQIGPQLRHAIIRGGLHKKFNVQLIRTAVEQTSIRKIDVLKNAAKSFIEERFSKNPDAQVIVYQFDDVTEVLPGVTTKESMLQAVDDMQPRGGTNIFRAIATAIQEFQRAPSAVKSHQIVLVSDAESREGEVILNDLLPKLKELGIVLDFIYVKGQTVSFVYNSEKELNMVCKQTSGEYVEVNTPSEFNQKFLKAASRLCLPPARL